MRNQTKGNCLRLVTLIALDFCESDFCFGTFFGPFLDKCSIPQREKVQKGAALTESVSCLLLFWILDSAGI